MALPCRSDSQSESRLRRLIHELTHRHTSYYNAGILALLLWAGINSGRAGLSRLFSEYSATSNSLAAANRALDYNSNDAEAHYLHALQLGDPAAAILELQRATTLRPEDYFLWQELGRVREENGDSQGAIIALQTATKLAPFYAQPHWQLGNALLRTEQVADAFAEMRIAVTNDPDLFPSLMDLAFGVYDGDAQLTYSAVAPQTDHELSLVIEFFLKHDSRNAALELVKSLKNVDAEDRKRIVASLVAAEDFGLAYDVWLNGRSSVNGLYDGGFEGAITSDDNTFGWQSTKLTQTLKLLLDTETLHSGSRSLRIDYAGNFDEATPVIAQLFPVDSNSRYQISFISRSEALFSAGLPIVSVTEAGGERKDLSESPTLASGSKSWNGTSFVFETNESTKAVRLNVQRTPCNVKPCPITGKLWLDDFVLTKLN